MYSIYREKQNVEAPSQILTAPPPAPLFCQLEFAPKNFNQLLEIRFQSQEL